MEEYKKSALQSIISSFVSDRDAANAEIDRLFATYLQRDGTTENFVSLENIKAEVKKLADAETRILAVKQLYARFDNLNQLSQLNDLAKKLSESIPSALPKINKTET